MLQSVTLSSEHSVLEEFRQTFLNKFNKVREINHMTIHLIDSKQASFCLSSSPKTVKNYIENEHYRYDYSLVPSYSRHLPFYSWASCKPNMDAKKLDDIKQDIYGLHSGINLIRSLKNGMSVIYSIASYSTDPIAQFIILSKVNQLLNSADSLFNQFHEVYQAYYKTKLPKLNFEPFTGGYKGDLYE